MKRNVILVGVLAAMVCVATTFLHVPIVGGGYVHLGDTVIYLDYSRIACLLGVCKRILTTYGQIRPDMGEGCPERVDLDFLKWVWNFNKNKRKKNYELLEKVEGIRVVILRNRRQLKRFLEQL